MIPALLLIGLVLGGFVHDRRGALIAGVVAIALSLGWGTLIGVADGAVATAVAASLLGFANLLVGATVTASIRLVARWVTNSAAPAAH